MSAWTDHEQATLERMAAEGATGQEIATALGKSRSAVLGRAFRTGVSLAEDEAKRLRLRGLRDAARAARPRPPRAPLRPRVRQARPLSPVATARAARRQLAEDLYHEGATYAEIAEMLGLKSVDGVYHYVKNLPRRRHVPHRVHTADFKVEVMAEILAGESAARVCARSGCSEHSIPNWRKRADLMALAEVRAAEIIGAREAEARTAAILKAQAEARERMWVDANNAEVFPRMSERHATMMRLRVDGKTLEEAAAPFGITRERVRQIEVRWRLKGLIVPGTAPLTEASRRMVYVPTGAPRGRKPKTPKMPVDFWEAAQLDLEDDRRRSAGKRPYRISPEAREAKSQKMKVRMEAYWAARRGEAAA